jgi:hypothetical protein
MTLGMSSSRHFHDLGNLQVGRAHGIEKILVLYLLCIFDELKVDLDPRSSVGDVA